MLSWGETNSGSFFWMLSCQKSFLDVILEPQGASRQPEGVARQRTGEQVGRDDDDGNGVMVMVKVELMMMVVMMMLFLIVIISDLLKGSVLCKAICSVHSAARNT